MTEVIEVQQVIKVDPDKHFKTSTQVIEGELMASCSSGWCLEDESIKGKLAEVIGWEMQIKTQEEINKLEFTPGTYAVYCLICKLEPME